MNLLLDDGDGDGELSIKVNESYAKRFEHNKQREELHRLQEKHPEVATREQNKASRLPAVLMALCAARRPRPPSPACVQCLNRTLGAGVAADSPQAWGSVLQSGR